MISLMIPPSLIRCADRQVTTGRQQREIFDRRPLDVALVRPALRRSHQCLHSTKTPLPLFRFVNNEQMLERTNDKAGDNRRRLASN
jgi:hypothetical protein